MDSGEKSFRTKSLVQKTRQRNLKDPTKVFEHNAWDDVEWDDEQETEARKKVEMNSHSFVEEQVSADLEQQADVYWDKFYGIHQNRFFKDRQWLFCEFPELSGDKSLSNLRTEGHGHVSLISCVGNQDQISSSATLEVQSEPVCDNQSLQAEVSQDQLASKCGKLDGIAESNAFQVSSTCVEQGLDSACDHPEDSAFPGEKGTFRLWEVGCGVGNTVFPILETNNDPGVFVYCCDLSKTAIDLVKEHRLYDTSRCHAFVCDVTNDDEILPFPENSLDIVICIFVVSAIHPEKMQSTFNRFARCLKPGGRLLFRDYGRYDLAQLRFKTGQCLSENFYARQDGTRVYFFTQEELRSMLTQAGLVEEQNSIDRRLQVNRRTLQKLYRVWIQCKYRKPELLSSSSTETATVT